MNMNQQQVVVPQKQGETGRTVLFVSELPENITEEDLQNFFSEYKDSIFMTQINNKFGNSRGVDSFHPRSLNATIIFKDHKKADDARKNLNMRKLRGKTIRIMWHERDNNVRYNTQGNLFIKNIPLDINARQFYEKFLQYGDIISAKLIEDEEGNHNGYGYVSYYNNESADNAIASLNNKEVWPGAKLEVARFQKKNERFSAAANKLSMNKNLYVKNIPDNFNDADLKTLFGKHGNVTWSKILLDANQRKSAIISMETEDAANKAREALNNHAIGEATLYVDSLQKKSDRQRILSSKIHENNSILNSQFKNCNLHIKNLPEKCSEKQLSEEFSKYGEIKSLKIPKYILVTKVGNQLKEEMVSRGFGYVCFFSPESAKKAKEEMNNQVLSSFSESKRPLLIDFFMPKVERKNILLKYQQQFNPNGRQQMPLMNPMSFGAPNQMGMPFGMGHPMMNKPGKNASIYQQAPVQRGVGIAKPIPTQMPPQYAQVVKKEDEPDIAYYNSIEDDSAKKEYLGEFIFKKISNHALNHSKGFTIDVIGKITGMILGIDDLNEILDICRNNENLTARIVEALTLLNI